MATTLRSPEAPETDRRTVPQRTAGTVGVAERRRMASVPGADADGPAA